MLYLIDSGGQYYYGTTDATRTLALNVKNKKIKDIYTRVLKGHIALSKFKIKNKTFGKTVDLAARKFLKKVGVTSQQKIEEAVRKGIANNSIKTSQIKVKVKLEINELDLSHEIDGEIHLEDD